MPSIVEQVAPAIIAYHWVGKVTIEDIQQAAVLAHDILDEEKITVYIAILNMRDLKVPPRDVRNMSRIASQDIQRGVIAYIILGLPSLFHAMVYALQRITGPRHIPANTWAEAIQIANDELARHTS